MSEHAFKVSTTRLHAHVISDGHASIDDVLVKVETSLHQAFLQIVDVYNLCFMHTLLYNTHISKF